MIRPKLKTLVFVALSLTFLVAPFALDFTPTGKAYALGGGGGSGSGGNEPTATQQMVTDYKVQDVGNKAPHPTPEPGTIALFGVGLIGVAIYARKKFKK